MHAHLPNSYGRSIYWKDQCGPICAAVLAIPLFWSTHNWKEYTWWTWWTCTRWKWSEVLLFVYWLLIPLLYSHPTWRYATLRMNRWWCNPWWNDTEVVEQIFSSAFLAGKKYGRFSDFITLLQDTNIGDALYLVSSISRIIYWGWNSDISSGIW